LARLGIFGSSTTSGRGLTDMAKDDNSGGYQGIAVKTLERARKASLNAETDQGRAEAQFGLETAKVYAILDLAHAIRGGKGDIADAANDDDA
jgi:hypothetical protein